MPAFFIPEPGLDGTTEEAAYTAIRKTIQAGIGHEPQATRIFKLWWRRSGGDCEAEVGKPDPVCGETVLAIFDSGRQGPYLIACCSSNGGTAALHEVDKPVYAVTKFTA
jgi:hypothetical protein